VVTAHSKLLFISLSIAEALRTILWPYDHHART